MQKTWEKMKAKYFNQIIILIYIIARFYAYRNMEMICQQQ